MKRMCFRLKLASVLTVFVFLSFFNTNKVEAATLDYQSTSVFGTSALDYGTAMKTDSDGNLYTAGQFNAGTVDFDPTSGVDNKTNTLGGYDIFLTKINADGTYGWTKTWGGTGNDASYNLAIDSSNNVYIVGEFYATVDFDPGVGDTSYTSAGSVDVFLSKFDTNGNFLSVKVMGSTSHDRAHGVVINGTGEIFIAGKFSGTVDFDPSGGTDSKLSAGGYDAFLTKFNADGSYGWTKTWGSTDRDTVNDLQLGSDGSIYMAGVYRLTVDFDPSGATSNQTSVGLDDAFLSKFTADGTYAWTKTWGSTSNDFSFNLRVNSSNDVYIIGSFQGTVDFDPSGATNSIVSAGLEDSYVSKFDSNGNYVFTRVWGGALMDEVLGITIDTGGNYFIGGFFNGTQDLDPTGGTDSRTSTGAYDMFVAMFDTNDNYITSKTFGSSTETNWWDDQLYELHAYHGTLNITGNFVGTADFDPTSGIDTKVAVGNGDYFRSTYSTGYTINFNAQGGSVDTASKTVTYYAAVGSLPTPTLSGQSFSGWNTAANGSGTSYTSSSRYLLNTDLTLYAIFGPTPTPAPEGPKPQISIEDIKERGGTFAPAGDSSPIEQHISVQIQPQTFNFNAFVSAKSTDPDDLPKPTTPNGKITSNPEIVVAGNFIGLKTTSGTSWQIGKMLEIWYKAYAPGFLVDGSAKIIPELQLKVSNIGLSYTDLDLIPPGQPNMRFDPKQLKLAHSIDGIAWTILKNSVVDPVNHTVAVLGKVGGYYVIVASVEGEEQGTETPKTKTSVQGASTQNTEQTQPTIAPEHPTSAQDVQKGTAPLPPEKSWWEKIVGMFR